MADFTASIAIEADAARVWAVLADHRRDPEWRTGVLEMLPDRDGLASPGMTTYEVLRLGGRTYRNTGVIRAVVPGERIEWRTVEGADAHGARSVRPTPDGCEVRLELHVHPTGVDRLLLPVLRVVLARNLRRDLVALAGVVDREESSVPS